MSEEAVSPETPPRQTDVLVVGPAQGLAQRHRERLPELQVHRFAAAARHRLPDGTAVLVRPDGFVAELVGADVGTARA